MKRTVQMKNAGTATAGQKSRFKGFRWPVRASAPHTVRSLHAVGGKRPDAFSKRRKHRALKLGFPSWAALVDAMTKRSRA